MKQSAYERAKDQHAADETPTITDWRCRAHGCPNAGCMDGGVCFFHWRESDPLKWAGVTQMVRENYEQCKNWGELSPELQARYRANAAKLFPGIKANRPKGMVTV